MITAEQLATMPFRTDAPDWRGFNIQVSPHFHLHINYKVSEWEEDTSKRGWYSAVIWVTEEPGGPGSTLWAPRKLTYDVAGLNALEAAASKLVYAGRIDLRSAGSWAPEYYCAQGKDLEAKLEFAALRFGRENIRLVTPGSKSP